MITSFTNEYAFLSNFYLTNVTVGGITYPSAEHAYVAQKSLNIKTRIHVATIKTPSEAKKFGRSINLHPTWERIKIMAMHGVLRAKFSDPLLMDRLLQTGDEILVEGNHWGDKFWGAVWDGDNWNGENNLGITLMYIRQEERANALYSAYNTPVIGHRSTDSGVLDGGNDVNHKKQRNRATLL